MASVRTLRSQGITVTDRFQILRAKIDELSRDERSTIKDAMRHAIQPFLDRAEQELRHSTQTINESNETMEFRNKGWDKYGVQNYVLQRSANKGERYFGISLANGWKTPEIDFAGSGRNRIGFNIRFANIAPQAPLVLLGEYKKDSWDVPSGPMHGGRRVMMWERPDGTHGFRWDTQGPLTVKRPRPYTVPMENAEIELEESRPMMIKAIQEAIIREFETI